MKIKIQYLLTMITTLTFAGTMAQAEPVFAVKADIYQLESEITIDSKIEETLKSKAPIHQPRLLAALGKTALIEMGSTERLTALEVLTTPDGAHYNAAMKLKDKVDGKWESITSFMPNIPNGQTVYFSRNVADSVWLIKLSGKRYESVQLGQDSFKN